MNGGNLPFGKWLKQRRKTLDLTKEELAQRVGCSFSAIEKIESGERRPSRQVAGLLAECLGIPPDERDAFARFARSEPQQALTTQPGEIPTASPWRAAYRERTNLPLPLTSLVGRTHQVEEVKNLLLRERARLVTLTGPPGIGKSRLSLEAASELADDFEDGVFFVPLSSINDSGLVLPAIARLLHIQEAANGSLADSLKKYLRDKSALLVLDNFEQVIDASPSVADLLNSSPWLKVLVTSREPLRVRGERRFIVPPLDLPDLEHLPGTAALLECSSIALFVERAQESNPNFELSDESAKVVAALCSRLDGLPLAIELVATSQNVFSPETLLKAMEDSLGMPSELQDVPSRHQTLRDATRWSYDLLDPGEQKLFSRLGVFAGGCTITAAEAVCNAQGDFPLKVSKGLSALVTKSLVNEQRPGPKERQIVLRDEQRYTMLQTIREFALERLHESGESDTICHLHAEYYLALAEAAESELEGPQQADLMALLENEHDNLRVVLDWAFAEGEVELALQLCAALARFWSALGYLGEGRKWLEAALAKAGSGISSHRTKALVGAGVLASRQGDYEQAIAFYEEALALYRARGDKKGTALALSRLGAVANEQGDFDKADGFYQEGLALARELGDKVSTAGILNNLGNQEVLRGNVEQAAAFYFDSLQFARELGNKQKTALALLNLGRLAFYHQGDFDRAASYLEESLSLYRELGSKGGIAATLYQLGRAKLYQKRYSHAQTFLEESLRLCEQLREMPGIAATRLGLGVTALLQGGYKEAKALLSASLTLHWEQGLKGGVIECLEGLGGLAAMKGEAEVAARLLGAVESLREDIGLNISEVHNALFAGWVEQARAQVDEDIFIAAWNEGRAMEAEEAVLFASH
jgi:predicted ATPase/DNA-binding XRE family transcriptional regulator